MLRVRGVVFDLLSQLGDVGVDGAGEGDGVVAPLRVEKLLSGHNLAGVLEEVVEEPELARGERVGITALGGLVPVQIDGDVSELVDRLGTAARMASK